MRSEVRNSKAIPAILIAVFAAIPIIWLCSSRAGLSAKACVDMPKPEKTVEAFFEALEAGRYSECDALLANYSSIGLPETADSEIGQTLLELLHSSYSFQIITADTGLSLVPPSSSDVSATDEFNALRSQISSAGTGSVSGKTAVCPVLFTYLDISAISDELHSLSTRIAHERGYDTMDIGEPEANSAISAALEIISSHIEDYYRTDVFEIQLEYISGEWKLVLSDELFDALIGNIGQ